ncbi:UNVERIFIED_CONTAM: hypothetical protein FKN15_035107 [Acipenser sinensis]
MSNCPKTIDSTFQQNFLPPVFGVEFCVALLGNSLAIWLLLTRERRQWHTGIVFVFNLAVCDLLYVLSLPLLIGYYTNDKNWIFSDALCRIERFLFTCNLYGSIFFITCISLNRYVGIVHPFFMRSSICGLTTSSDSTDTSLAIWLLLTRERRQWHTGIVFVFNLAVCDLLYVLSLPLLIGYYTNDKNWIFSDALCRIERFLFTCNLYGSIFFITCISLNRYVGIVHPFFMRSYVQPKHAMMVSLAVWFLVIGICSPVFHFSMTEEKGNQTQCLGSATDGQITEYIPYSLFLASFGCALPFLATFASYFAILVVVWKNDNITNAEKRKIGVMIFTVIVLYVVSFIPYHVLRNVNLFNRDDSCSLPPSMKIYDAYQVSKVLVTLNMCIHPLLYVSVFDSMRAICGLSTSSDSTDSLAIWLLLTRERRQWHTGIVFVFNLAVCDLLYVLSLPLLIGYYTNDKNWIFSDALCRIERFLFTCNLYGSIFFITCISLNRYVGIVHPFFTRSYVQPKHAMMVSLAVWFLVIGICSPVFHFSMTEKKGNKTQCLGSATDDKITEYIPYSLFLASFGCALPFLATFSSYFAILVVVWKNDNITSADKRKTGVMIFTVIVLYVVSFIPYHILRNVNLINRDDRCSRPPSMTIYDGYQVSKVLVTLNMCIHPLLYVSVFDSMRAICGLSTSIEIKQTPSTNVMMKTAVDL